MKNTKKIKNDFLNTALVCSSLLFSMPNIGYCIPSTPTSIFNPSSADFDSIIYNLFNHANRGDLEGIELQLKNIERMLEQSNDALTDSCQFLKDLVNKMNAQYGTTYTLSELLQITRESVRQFGIPENQVENYMVGLDLIELHQSSLYEIDSSGFVYLVKHHKDKSNFWTWLTIATITAAAVTVCIVVPQAAPAVIGGAVEVGKAALGK